MSRSAVAWVVALVHTLLLAAYVLPLEFVPTRLHYWSVAYARPLFHQDWRLFAPDPPACSCVLSCEGEKEMAGGIVLQRATDGLCRYALECRRTSDGLEVPRVLLKAISHVKMVGSDTRCIVIHQCATDSASTKSLLWKTH